MYFIEKRVGMHQVLLRLLKKSNLLTNSRQMRYEKALFITAVSASVAVSLNFIILKLFKQKSSYRAEHSMIGVITLMILFATFLNGSVAWLGLVGLFLLALIPC